MSPVWRQCYTGYAMLHEVREIFKVTRKKLDLRHIHVKKTSVRVPKVELWHNNMNRDVGFTLGKSRNSPSHWLKEWKKFSRYRKKRHRRETRQHQVIQFNQPANQKTNKGCKKGANLRFLSGRTKTTSDVKSTPFAPFYLQRSRRLTCLSPQESQRVESTNNDIPN
jgi:hypothetical protein